MLVLSDGATFKPPKNQFAFSQVMGKCSGIERQWKQSGLSLFYEIWNDKMLTYQKEVREA